MRRIIRVLRLLRDPRVRRLPRVAVVAALVYLAWPADLIPEIVTPLFGFIDDAVVLWLAFRWLLRSDPGPEPPPPAPSLGP